MKKHNAELREVRNTIESLWISIVLALVLRAFLFEGYNIPTGSMAPRLMGMHVQVVCPDCGYSFPRGVGRDDTGRSHEDPKCWCPNCGEDLSIDSTMRRRSGDYVFVLKLPEILRPLQRWDVVVFKDPASNSLNFIKRLVGLPGEAIRIVHGDLFSLPLEDTNSDGVLDENDLPDGPLEADGWRIVRKGFETQQAIWQLMFDSEYVSSRLVGYHSPWKVFGDLPGVWDMKVDNGRTWSFDGSAPASLRYAVDEPGLFLPVNSYNTEQYNRVVSSYCSDLKLETIVQPQDSDVVLRLVLGNFEHRFAAELDMAAGKLSLLHTISSGDGLDWSHADNWGQTEVNVKPGKPIRLAIYHVDWTVGVCLDDEPVIISSPQQYDADADMILDSLKQSGEPRPVARIEAQGGSFSLGRTRLLRDMFYVEPSLYGLSLGVGYDYARDVYADKFNGLDASVSWASPYNPMVLRKYPDDRRHFDEFFMCGDNSPASYDSRAWTKASPTLRLYNADGSAQYRLGTVPRYNLVGKAVFVYWPSGYPMTSNNKLPYLPNVGKVRRIH